MRANKILRVFSLFALIVFLKGKPADALTLNGSLTATNPTVSGDVTITTVTVSTLAVSNVLNIQGKVSGLYGRVLQTVISSTSVTATTTSSFTPESTGLSAGITLHGPNNYVRVSLSGSAGTLGTCETDVDVYRDNRKIGTRAIADGWPGVMPVGLRLTDSPGNMFPHTYEVMFNVCSPPQTGSFTVNPVAWLILEEVEWH